MDPTSFISHPAVYLAEGFLKKKERKNNAIQSTWSHVNQLGRTPDPPFSVRATLLMNFGRGVKSGLAILLIQIVFMITWIAQYEKVNPKLCEDYGYFCNSLLPIMMRGIFVLMVFEILVDVYFGVFKIVRTRHIQMMVNWVADHSELHPKRMYAVLNVWTWAISIFCTLVFVFMITVVSIGEYYTNYGWWSFFYASVNVYSTWCTLFLSVLWIWENWLLSEVADYFVQQRLERDFGTDGVVAGLRCHELLQKMSEVSRVWAPNHAFRVILGFMDISFYIIWYIITKRGDQNAPPVIMKIMPAYYAMILLMSIVFYIFVVGTILAPGFVTSKFFTSLQLKVSELTNWVSTESMRASMQTDQEQRKGERRSLSGTTTASGKGDTGDAKEQTNQTRKEHHLTLEAQHEIRNFQQSCTMFMTRFSYIQNAGGMHFAGFPISVGQALTGVFIAGYMQYDVIKYIVSE